MTQRVHIPDSIEKAIVALNGIGQLLKAKEWERAAIVYAFTRDGSRGPGANTETLRSESLSAEEFSALGIVGLESGNTVRNYRQAWKDAITADKASDVQPGQIVTLPTLTWPGSDSLRSLMQRKSKVRLDLESPDATPQSRAAFVRSQLADPDVADELEDDIVEMAAQSPRITAKVLTTSAERRPAPPEPERPFRDMVAYSVGASAIAHARRAYEDIAAILKHVTERGYTNLPQSERAVIQDTINSLQKAGDLHHRYAAMLSHGLGEGPEPEPATGELSWIDQIESELARMGRE